MGTRADFYVGRGRSAEWLGSVGLDGYPDGLRHEDFPAGTKVLAATTEADFRAAVAEFLGEKSCGTTPGQGWPWPWDDSNTTDFAYAFDGGGVYVSHFGYGWRPAAESNDDTEWDESKSAEFPNMAERKNVAFDGRSGAMFFAGPR